MKIKKKPKSSQRKAEDAKETRGKNAGAKGENKRGGRSGKKIEKGKKGYLP